MSMIDKILAFVATKIDKNIIELKLTRDVILGTSRTKLVFSEAYRKGTKLSMSAGGIKIGPGVAHVKVSFNGRMNPSTTTSVTNAISLTKNSTSIFENYCQNIGGGSNNLEMADIIVPVTEGDVLYIYGSSSSANTGRANAETRFIAEVID